MKEHPEQLPRRLVQELDACYVVVDEWDDFVEATKLKAVLLAPILSRALSSGIQFILTANSGKLKDLMRLPNLQKQLRMVCWWATLVLQEFLEQLQQRNCRS